MKLAATIPQPLQPDSHVRNRDANPAERQGDEPDRAFRSALKELTNKEPVATTPRLDPTKAAAGNIAREATLGVGQEKRAAHVVSNGSVESIGNETSQPDASLPSSDDEELVGSLLKRFKSKGDDEIPGGRQEATVSDSQLVPVLVRMAGRQTGVRGKANEDRTSQLLTSAKAASPGASIDAEVRQNAAPAVSSLLKRFRSKGDDEVPGGRQEATVSDTQLVPVVTGMVGGQTGVRGKANENRTSQLLTSAKISSSGASIAAEVHQNAAPAQSESPVLVDVAVSKDLAPGRDNEPHRTFGSTEPAMPRLDPSKTAAGGIAREATIGESAAELDALLEPIGSADSIGNEAGRSAASPQASDDEESVGSLLKRFKSKGDDEIPGGRQDATVSDTQLPPVLAAMVGPQPGIRGEAHEIQTSQLLPSAKSSSAGTSIAVEGKQDAALAQTASQIVLDVAVSKHLAPGREDNPQVSLDDDGQTERSLSTGRYPSASVSPAGTAVPGDHEDGAPQTESDPRSHIQVEAPATDAAAPAATFGIIKSLATAVHELASQSLPATAPLPAPKAVATTAAHTVTLQMNPGDLGNVEIRLHLTGQVLDLQLKISEQRTLGLVARERDALASALHAHDYMLNSLVIQDGSAATQPGGSHAAQHDRSSDPQPQGGSRDGPGAKANSNGRQGRKSESQAGPASRPQDQARQQPRVPGSRSLFI